MNDRDLAFETSYCSAHKEAITSDINQILNGSRYKAREVSIIRRLVYVFTIKW